MTAIETSSTTERNGETFFFSELFVGASVELAGRFHQSVSRRPGTTERCSTFGTVFIRLDMEF